MSNGSPRTSRSPSLPRSGLVQLSFVALLAVLNKLALVLKTLGRVDETGGHGGWRRRIDCVRQAPFHRCCRHSSCGHSGLNP